MFYRVRAMDVNTAVDNFDAMIASHGEWFARRGVARGREVPRCTVSKPTNLARHLGYAMPPPGGRSTTFQLAEP